MINRKKLSTDKQIDWIAYRDNDEQGIENGEAEQYKDGRLNFGLARLTKEQSYELINNYF